MNNRKIKILSVNLSKERGRKYPVKELVLNESGINGDAHSGTTRQISIFEKSHSDYFRQLTKSREFESGEFAENLLVSGLENTEVKEFDIFKINDAELEVTQIGKPFHRKFQEPGHYIMPHVGIFCRVKKPGTIKPGDIMTFIPKIFNILIITLSDRASKGVYEDLSGLKIKEILNDYFQKTNWRYNIISKIIPDDAEMLKSIIRESKNNNTDIIITTGGTGIGKRDITVDTIKPILDKEIPGIMEMIRLKYGMEAPNALLSRGVAGVIDNSLIYTLPGSVRAVKEYMQEILKTLQHLIYMLNDIDKHSQNKKL